jgi:phosphopantetheine adenylyltransferase
MTTLAVLAAFGVVIAITAETVRSKQASQIAAKDKRIAELERQLAESNDQRSPIVYDHGNLGVWAALR